MRINLPTWLTLLRILMLPVIVVVFYLPWHWASLAAAVVFVAAAATDWLDGWLARRMALTSSFGAFLDPVADKLMVTVALFLLVADHPSALLALTAAVIVGREIGVSALREWMAEIGQRARVRVRWLGKLKTIVQFIAIVVLLVEHDARTLRFYKVGEILLLLAAALTLLSGFGYLRAAWPSLSSNDPHDRA